jgi:two-component system capsular synthesis response regulator RcsB
MSRFGNLRFYFCQKSDFMEAPAATFRSCERPQAWPGAGRACQRSIEAIEARTHTTNKREISMVNLRVILADDHPFVLLGVRSALSVHSDIMIAGEAASPAALIDLLQRRACDVLVTDLTMSEMDGAAEDGLRLIRRIRQEWPTLRIVVLTSLTHTAILRSVVSDGAVSMLNKTEPMAELVAAIRSASTGRAYISRSILEALARLDCDPSAMPQMRRLSPRESEVIGMFAQGQSISEIARTLGRDVRTVSRQKRFAMTKPGVTNDPGLSAYVRAHGNDRLAFRSNLMFVESQMFVARR